MRRSLVMLFSGSLALSLSYCADTDATDESVTAETAAQTVQPIDGGSRDLGGDATPTTPGKPLTPAAPATPAAPTADASVPAAPFAITSTVVQDKGTIPKAYRCNTPSPPLAWTPGPADTKSYAVVFRDQGNGFYHWVIYDIPASEVGLATGVPVGAAPAKPAGAKQAPNWSRTVGYGGPCAPFGVSNYAFTLYALDVAKLPGLTATSTAAQVVTAIEAHDLASTKLSIQSSP